jgi:uncharacterized protein (TIGR00730 family)
MYANPYLMTSTAEAIKSVTFFGSSLVKPGDKVFESAFQVAKIVAESGRRVVNGGGPGIMLAATLGAKEAKGKTSVVYYKPELATEFKGEVAANFADEHFEEKNYIKRTQRLLEMSDAYIIFNGGTGTISEFAMAWGVARLYFGHHKPLILYGDFWHEIIETFKKEIKVKEQQYKVFKIVNKPQAVLQALQNYEDLLFKIRHRHKECKGVECFLFL